MNHARVGREPGQRRTDQRGGAAGKTVTTPSPARYRVVQIFGVLDVGGAELRAIELLPELTRAGADIHFVTLTGRRGTLAPTVEGLGAEVHPMPVDIRFPVRFVRFLTRLRPRVVHSNVATFSGALLLLAAVARVPVRIAHFQSDGDEHGSSLRRRVQRWLMRKLIHFCATDIVGVAPNALRHGYRADYPADRRCRVLPNGLNLDRLTGASGYDLRQAIDAAPGDVVCLHVGRPSPAKRRWLVPPIVAEALACGVAVRGVLVGARDDDDDRRVLDEARALGVAERLHLLGPRDDVGALMRQADLLLLPSDREGLPSVVLEALAVGTPVVGSDLPGVCFIAGELPGVVTVPRDAAPSEWATAIADLVSRAGGTGDRAAAEERFRASVFSLRAAAAEHLRLYRALPTSPAVDHHDDPASLSPSH
ncbi:glycosyltransferase family 4 protein [Micromonospora sp. WMMD754]|uniref:glycosyltransferase family 4 protein n=1 Tax=Micromonospora sp. WMMD754 TaxID=3404114 RepID=UPI003BF57FE4